MDEQRIREIVREELAELLKSSRPTVVIMENQQVDVKSLLDRIAKQQTKSYIPKNPRRRSKEEMTALEEQARILETAIKQAKAIIPSGDPNFEAALKRADCFLQSLRQQHEDKNSAQL